MAPPAPTPASPRNFNPPQLETFLSLADTLIPALSPSELAQFRATLEPTLPPKSEEEWARILTFARTPASESQGFLDAVGFMERNMNAAQWKAVTGILDLLRTRVGSLFLCRTWTPFHQQPLATRTSILKSWSTSNLTTCYKLFKALSGLVRYCYAQTSTVYMGINIPPRDPDAHSERYTLRRDTLHKFVFQDLSALDAELNADVIIVGTGAGGGVVAKKVCEWAQSKAGGPSVLVLEQGEYIPHEQLTLSESESVQRMWDRGVMTSSIEGDMTTGYGRTFGGGTAINWSVSLRTPGGVRREWATGDSAGGGGGIPWFQSKEFTDALERVEKRMGVSSKNLVHNNPNGLMLEACEVLGYGIEVTPVNSGGMRHGCGWCGHGCRYGEKMGSMNSWLVDASQAGARFAQRVSVRRVLFDKEEVLGAGGRRRKRVVGVEAVVDSDGAQKKIVINCKKVIISCGSLHTPALLLRSGLTNPHIGAHLRLHPVSFIYGFYPPSHPRTPISPHLGPVISTVVIEPANLSGPYGARIEAGYMFPLVGLAQIPWLGGEQWKNYLCRYENMVGLFGIARDGRTKRGSCPSGAIDAEEEGFGDDSDALRVNHGGKVLLDKVTGEPIYSYTLHPLDAQSLLSALVIAAEILLVSGATELVSAVRNLPPYIPPQDALASPPDQRVHHPSFRAWQAQLESLGAKDGYLPISSAHQMGSCSMVGVSWEDGDRDGIGRGCKRGGVVDQEGRVFGVEGLWVADASVLPGATGVNPMVSVMGVGEVIAGRMVGRWEEEGWWRGEKREEK